MSIVWYKDPESGDIYQDRIDSKGRSVRAWRKYPKEGSRVESSSTPRNRSQSVFERSANEPGTRRQREKSTVRETTRGDRRPSYTESDPHQPCPEDSTTYADQAAEAYFDSSRQASTSYQARDVFEPASSTRQFDSTQPRRLSPRPYDPGTADSLVESFDAVRFSSHEHYTQSPRVASATRDWQPPIASSRHEETTFLSSDRDPSQPLYSSRDYHDEPTLATSQIQQQELDRVVKGTPGSVERIDSSYKVRNRDYQTFFRVGRVFSTLWTDALGNNAGKVDPTFVSEVLYGERVYSKIRRFVVVREGERFVSCLPVTSYASEGIKKSGIRLDEHGFIYSRNKHKKIEGMCTRPLQLVLAQGAAHLKDPSLVNYGKVYNVETNVKVKNVGTLDKDSEAILLHYFRKIYSGIIVPGGVGITPRASEAVLFGVGAALNSYPAPIPAASYMPPTASGSGFTSASTVTGYPPAAPTVYGSSSDFGARDGPSVYYHPSSQHETSSSMSYRPTSKSRGMESTMHTGPNTYSGPSMHSQNQSVGAPLTSSSHGSTYTSENAMDPSSRSSTYYPASNRDGYYPAQISSNPGYSSSDFYQQPSSNYPAASGGNDYFLQPISASGQPPQQYPTQSAYPPQPSEPTLLSSGFYEDDIDLADPDPDRESAIARRRRSYSGVLDHSCSENRNSKSSFTTAPGSSGQVEAEGKNEQRDEYSPKLRYTQEPASPQIQSQSSGSNLPMYPRISSPRKDRGSTTGADPQNLRTTQIQYPGSSSQEHQHSIYTHAKEVTIELESELEREYPQRDQEIPLAAARNAVHTTFDQEPQDHRDQKISGSSQEHGATGPVLYSNETNKTFDTTSAATNSDEPIVDSNFSTQPVGPKSSVNAVEESSSATLHRINPETTLYPQNPGVPRRPSSDSIDTTNESTLFSSSFSAATTSSVDNGSSKTQRLCDFLFSQEWLQALSKEALQKVSPIEFEENLRRILIQFAIHLNHEAKSRPMVQVAGAVRRRAINAASLLRHSLEQVANCTDDILLQNHEDGIEDDDDDDDDLLENKEDGEDEYKDLEFLLSNSMALQLLKENLQLFVHPDPIKRALFQVWPITHPRDSTLEIKYSLEWEVPHFLSTYFADGQELGKVLTVTGEANKAQAQTCGDYLAQTWPEIGAALLASLQQELSTFETQGISETNRAAIFDLEVGASPGPHSSISKASICVLRNHTDHEKMLSALCWICAAVRHSPYLNVAYSYTTVVANRPPGSSPTIAIRLADLEELQRDGSCWHALLPHGVIARGFPIQDRISGKGLDISFADMALLSQSLSFTEYDEGWIVEGLRSVLIPIKILPQDDAIQWHLEYKRQTTPPKKKSIPQLFEEAQVKEWHNSGTPEVLCKKRCFLGWVDEVAVMIGTAEFSNSKTYRSEALPTPKTRQVKSRNISMGASCFGIDANGSKTWQTTSMVSSAVLEIDKDIYDTLADDIDATVLVYDTRERTAWLLPQPSVILDLTYKILKRRKFPLFDGKRETMFKFAKPGPDGASEANSILQEIIRFNIQKSPYFRDKVANTVKQICLQMDLLGDQLAFATSEFELIGGTEEANLYGFEFNEVLDMKSRIDILQVKVDQPWTQMIRKRSIVLFCAGFGQPIIPVSSEKLCTAYMKIPAQRNLLATTGKVLHSLVEPYDQGPPGCTLGKRLQWSIGPSLVLSHGEHSPVFHEQSIRVVDKSSPDPLMLGSINSHITGGFIFTGHRSRKPCLEVYTATKSKFLNDIKHKVEVENKTLSLVPGDDTSSENSNESETGISTAQMPTSSISSDESLQVDKEPDHLSLCALTYTAENTTASTFDHLTTAYYPPSTSHDYCSQSSSYPGCPSSGFYLPPVDGYGQSCTQYPPPLAGCGLQSLELTPSSSSLYDDDIDLENFVPDKEAASSRRRRESRTDRRQR